jgi:hypothetical protein
LRDRVIEIRLERKPRGVQRAKLRETSRSYTKELSQKCLRWANDNAQAVSAIKPVILDTENDRAGNNWEFLLAIAGVIDPDNVDRVVKIALDFEGESSRTDRESDEDAVLKAIKKVYQDVCEDIQASFDDLETNIFISIATLRAVLNKDTLAPWAGWRYGNKWGIYERKIAEIIRNYARIEPERSRQEPAHSLANVSTADVRGYWLEKLRSTFERY